MAVKIGVVVVILIGLVVTGVYGWKLQEKKYWQDTSGKNERLRIEAALNNKRRVE